METIISAPIRASSSARHLNDIANLLSPFESVCAGDFLKPPPPVLREAVIISRLNVEQLEVGNVALFLSSDLASGITGEITFVDCGFNITGI